MRSGPANPIGSCAAPTKFSTLPVSADGSNEYRPTWSSSHPVCSAMKARRWAAIGKGRVETSAESRVPSRPLGIHRGHLLHRRVPGTCEAGDGTGRGQHEHPEGQEDGCGSVGADPAPRDGLLQGDEPGDDGHPHDAHDPQREKRRHEGPTTADAPGAVLRSHSERAREAVAPGAEQRAEWAAALAEADILERRELVSRRDDECAAG